MGRQLGQSFQTYYQKVSCRSYLTPQKNREGVAEHSFSVNGDVGLPDSFCIVQAEEGRLALGCMRFNLALVDQATNLFPFRCKDAIITSLLLLFSKQLTDGLGELPRLLNPWNIRFCLPQLPQQHGFEVLI